MGRTSGFSSTKWRLHGARLGSFLRNARAIRDLADDARSKYEDDYVFDRQYVVTVIERSLELTEALLFDARVIGADTGSLVRSAAECKAAAQQLTSSTGEGEPVAAGEHDDPEYSLLAHCSEWLDGRASRDAGCVMALVRSATDLVAEAIGEDRELEVKTPVPALEIPHAGSVRIADLGGGIESGDRAALSPRNIQCRPLGVLLAGVAEGAEEGARTNDSKWLAVVDRRHLSLRRDQSGARFLLEATLSGEHRSDWVFVYSTKGKPPELPGIRSEPTDQGWVLWQSDDASVDQVLATLGAQFFRR